MRFWYFLLFSWIRNIFKRFGKCSSTDDPLQMPFDVQTLYHPRFGNPLVMYWYVKNHYCGKTFFALGSKLILAAFSLAFRRLEGVTRKEYGRNLVETCLNGGQAFSRKAGLEVLPHLPGLTRQQVRTTRNTKSNNVRRNACTLEMQLHPLLEQFWFLTNGGHSQASVFRIESLTDDPLHFLVMLALPWFVPQESYYFLLVKELLIFCELAFHKNYLGHINRSWRTFWRCGAPKLKDCFEWSSIVVESSFFHCPIFADVHQALRLSNVLEEFALLGALLFLSFAFHCDSSNRRCILQLGWQDPEERMLTRPKKLKSSSCMFWSLFSTHTIIPVSEHKVGCKPSGSTRSNLVFPSQVSWWYVSQQFVCRNRPYYWQGSCCNWNQLFAKQTITTRSVFVVPTPHQNHGQVRISLLWGFSTKFSSLPWANLIAT